MTYEDYECVQFDVDGVEPRIGKPYPINKLPITIRHTFGDKTHLNDAQRQTFNNMYKSDENMLIVAPTVCLK